MTDRKAMSSSALRRRRQQVKKLRATLKRELAAIEAEMESRKDSSGVTRYRFAQNDDGTYRIEPIPC